MIFSKMVMTFGLVSAHRSSAGFASGSAEGRPELSNERGLTQGTIQQVEALIHRQFFAHEADNFLA
jgi:hypothetical protein